MTDVLALTNIPGLPKGSIAAHDARLAKHVAAGNAVVLPNDHESWEGEPEPLAPQIHQTATSDSTFENDFAGAFDDDEIDED